MKKIRAENPTFEKFREIIEIVGTHTFMSEIRISLSENCNFLPRLRF